MDPQVIAFLVAAAFVAAFIDSIVGGGGIITLPSLLIAGVPPHLALGTNKLAATGASLMATVRYVHAGKVVLPLVMALIPLTVLGAFMGAAAVLAVEAAFVRILVVLVMVAMTVYVLVRKTVGREDRFEGFHVRTLVPLGTFCVLLGFYDGFLGPGMGSMLLFLFLGVARFDFVRAAAHGRVLNFASNLAALVFFLLADSVVVSLGLAMLPAMMLGAWFGSHFGLRHGNRWIKPLFVVMSLAILARLLWQMG